MCYAKWTQVTISLGNGTTHSCHHPPKRVVPLEELKNNPSALHNTQHKKSIRQLMLSGKQPEECSNCWSVEKNYQEGVFSDRIKKSSTFWSRPFKNKILNDPLSNINPPYVEISFDNTCNLKCSYCNSLNSSKWVEEIKKFGGYPTSDNYHSLDVNLLPKQKDFNPYIESFWNWWPNLYPDLKVFRITGGEPLLSQHTFKVMDKIIDNPKKDLEFGVNTNLSVPNILIDSFIEKMQRIEVKDKIVYTSGEGFGVKGEYSRFGLNYDQWKINCSKILQQIPNCKLTIMSAFNVFSVSNYKMFINDLLELRKMGTVYIDVSYVRDPAFLSIFILDDSFEKYFVDLVRLFEDNNFSYFELNNVKRLYSVYKNLRLKDINLINSRHDFIKYVDELDKRRKTNFLQTFPELEDFYYNCFKQQ